MLYAIPKYTGYSYDSELDIVVNNKTGKSQAWKSSPVKKDFVQVLTDKIGSNGRPQSTSIRKTDLLVQLGLAAIEPPKGIWRDYPLDTDYQVSLDGRVWSKRVIRSDGRNRGGKLVAVSISSSGYYHLKITGGKTACIHRMVAETFLQKTEGKNYVNHKDGNKLNNNANNLEWCTASENTNHSINSGLQDVRGDSNGNSVHSNDVIAKVILSLMSGSSERSVSSEHSVPFHSVHKINNRCQWKWLSDILAPGTGRINS